MANTLRSSGISVVGDVSWGTHFCHFYESKQDLLDILIPYFKAGLENAECCVWVVPDQHFAAEAKQCLRQSVRAADLYLASGQIEISVQPPGYLNGDGPMPDRVIETLNLKLSDAITRGYAGLRVNGSGSGSGLKDGFRKQLAHYESALDKKLAGHRLILLCSYPLAGSSAAEIFDLGKTHQFVLLRRRGNWEVLETPKMIQSKQEINNLNEQLEFRVIERTGQLAALNDELRWEIAERRRTEIALRENEERFRQMAENIREVFWMSTVDMSKTLYISPAYESVWGMSRASIYRDIRSFFDAIHPEDRERVSAAMETEREKGFEVEYRIIRPDGSIRWIRDRGFPIEDELGHCYRLAGIAEDLTERKHAEDLLRRREDYLGLVIDTIPTMAWTLTADGLVDFVNQRWIDYTGVSLEECVEKPASPMHPDDVAESFEKWFKSVETGMPYEAEMRLRRSDGEYRWFLVRTAPLRDESGKIVRWYGVATDVDEQKHATEALQATSDQLRALSASLQSAREQESTRISREIHDELGGALTSLRWDLEEVSEVISDAPSSTELSTLRKKVEAMVTLTQTTLDTVRRLASELRPIALDELGLVEAVEWQARQFENRTGITVDFDCSLEKVDLDSQQSIAVFRILQEAFTNILRHAHASIVTVRMHQDEAQFLLTIKDNGRGITENEMTGSHSLGLLGMRERALLIGANIEIGCNGSGTFVTLSIPLNEE
jgi:PAS domain S-box-containing protein